MEYELNNLNEKFIVTGVDEQMEEELKRYGKLGMLFSNNKLNYHLDITPKDDSARYTISFLKGLYSYGYDENLWEAAIIAKKGRNIRGEIRGLVGFLTDDELLDFVRDSVASLSDPEYFDSLPREYKKFEYQRKRDNAPF